MRVKKIPQIFRNVLDSSITISYGHPKCSLIWLHGLCDTSQGFFSFFTHSHSPVYHGVKVKIIQAPLRHITINNGEVCNGWYDIMSTDRWTGDEKKIFNFDDIKQSHQIIDSHVKDEVKEWTKKEPSSLIDPYHRVFVGGFSQGGAMSLSYSMQAQTPPAGAISFSGYMFRSALYKNFRKVPMLLMHGTKDPLIRQIMAKKSYEKLLTDENLVEYRQVEGLQHTINLDQLDVLSHWLNETFKTIKHVYEKPQEKHNKTHKSHPHSHPLHK